MVIGQKGQGITRGSVCVCVSELCVCVCERGVVGCGEIGDKLTKFLQIFHSQHIRMNEWTWELLTYVVVCTTVRGHWNNDGWLDE